MALLKKEAGSGVPSNFTDCLSVILFTQFTKMKKELKEKCSRHNKPYIEIFLHLQILNYPQHYAVMHFRENKCTRSQMQYIFLGL